MAWKIWGTNRIGGADKEIEASESGAMFVAPGASKYEDICRSGMLFSAITTTATVSCTALPTTTAGIALYNSAADGGVSMIVDAIFANQITCQNILSQYGLIYVLGQTRVAALAGGLVIRRMNGLGPTTNSVCLANAGGAVLDAVTGVAIGWTPIGPTANTSVVSLPGAVLYAEVDGRLIIPPGHQFGVNVMGGDATGTWNCGVIWHEKQITLG
jgi:hypothetical protein